MHDEQKFAFIMSNECPLVTEMLARFIFQFFLETGKDVAP